MLDARYIMILALTLVLAGCYHARIETGMTPSNDVIDQPWAMSFVYGLVPPDVVNASAQCPAGVALVETRHSFLNQVVAAVSAGIVTPMHITVTCAQGGAALMTALMEAPENRLVLPKKADLAKIRATFDDAADQAIAQQRPVVVQFE